MFLRDLNNGLFNMANLNSSKYKTSKQNFWRLSTENTDGQKHILWFYLYIKKQSNVIAKIDDETLMCIHRMIGSIVK